MKYTEALKLFNGDEIKLRKAMRCDRQQMFYFRQHLKKGVDLELTDYRQLCIETHFKRVDERIKNWREVGTAIDNLVTDMIQKEEAK